MNSSDILIRLLKKHKIDFDISFDNVNLKKLSLSKIYISNSDNMFITERLAENGEPTSGYTLYIDNVRYDFNTLEDLILKLTDLRILV